MTKTRIINRELIAKDDDPDEPKVKERVTIRQAVARASYAMDVLPGIDSVALACKSLAMWSPQPEKMTNYDYTI